MNPTTTPSFLPDRAFSGLLSGYFVYLDDPDRPIGYVERSTLNPSVWDSSDMDGRVVAQRGSRRKAAAALVLHVTSAKGA